MKMLYRKNQVIQDTGSLVTGITTVNNYGSMLIALIVTLPLISLSCLLKKVWTVISNRTTGNIEVKR